ncbi:MAG TPA: zinc-binding alcohol dehydrogenase family protein, partial [Kiloniellaceae bacterium]|nr:zinc-binding alcohol dehydrogenase family protein [Kiloniellaceae bacterium]
MQAIGYYESLPIDQDAALVDVTLPTPEPGPRDLLVQVRAVSVNPVDVKVRQSSAPANGAPQILGFDAAGIVKAVGSEVTLFRPGDEVFYAGDYQRPGTNAEFHLVDERIVGRKPQSLTFSQAAALPLTAITAWELLFERFDVPLDGLPKDERPTDGRTDGSLLVIGGAGGVGSILIQLARQLTGLTVIATASRPETRAWCEKMGAHHVIDHTKSLPEELRRIGFDTVDFVASLTATA